MGTDRSDIKVFLACKTPKVEEAEYASWDTSFDDQIQSDILVGLKSNKELLDSIYIVKKTLSLFPNIRIVDTVCQADLVITVGGDGTFFQTVSSLQDENSPVFLSVNGSPSTSTASFSACTANDLQCCLSSIFFKESEEYAIATLTTLLVLVEKSNACINTIAINDVLYTSQNPGQCTNYRMSFPKYKKSEKQKSSGLWIATPAGSTAGIRSAGGYIEKNLSKKEMQYRVREPYGIIDLLGGRCDAINIINYSNPGIVCIDGSEPIRIEKGQTVQISIGKSVNIIKSNKTIASDEYSLRKKT